MNIVLSVCILLIGAWILLSRLPAGADRHMPLPYVIALIPLAWVPLGLLMLLALILAYFGVPGMEAPLRIALLVIALMLLNHEQMRRKFLPARSKTAHVVPTSEAHDRTTLNVMTLNCRYGRANAENILTEVRQHNIDALALQELSEELVQALEEQGIDDLLPHRVLGANKTDDNGGFNGLWLRERPLSGQADTVIPAAEVPSATLVITVPDHSGDGVIPKHIHLSSAHTKSPMRSRADWSGGIIGLGTLARTATDPHTDAIVMGDLNSDLNHPSFRKLLTAGFVDATLTLARPWHPFVRTFPSWLPWPRITLDHVLYTPGITASNVAPIRIEDTDHLALTATLTL